jgi:hypothetical protein
MASVSFEKKSGNKLVAWNTIPNNSLVYFVKTKRVVWKEEDGCLDWMRSDFDNFDLSEKCFIPLRSGTPLLMGGDGCGMIPANLSLVEEGESVKWEEVVIGDLVHFYDNECSCIRFGVKTKEGHFEGISIKEGVIRQSALSNEFCKVQYGKFTLLKSFTVHA